MDFITMYMTESEEKIANKQAKKQDKNIGDDIRYRLENIIFKDDGGSILVAEQYQFSQRTFCYGTGNGGTNCSTYPEYVYNDILLVSMAQDGSIEWNTKIPKRQLSINDFGAYSSFALQLKGDKMYFIFNDNSSNLSLAPGANVAPFAMHKNDYLTAIATVDADGRVKREALFTMDMAKVYLRPRNCVSLSNDQMLIYGDITNKISRFGRVQFH